MRKGSRSRSRSRQKKYKINYQQQESEDERQLFGIDKDLQERRKTRQMIYKQHLESKIQQKIQSSDSQVEQPNSFLKPLNIVASKQNNNFISTRFEEKKIQVQQQEDLDMFGDQLILQTYTNPTDSESYYRVVSGQILYNKYRVVEKCGKGVFGNVVKAINIQDNQEVAIKILRNNQILSRSGQKQFKFISKLNSPYIVKCYQYFFHRKHLCLVFQLLSIDLRQALKLHGKNNAGLELDKIKNYAIHMFIGLHAMRKMKLVHADVKPDNFLLSKDLKILKYCDFGTAFPIEQSNIVEYLVARYYRAPQIILGCNVDYAIDTWSIGCTLFELFTGEFFFPGRDNNEVLKLIMETKGKFSLKMLKKGAFTSKHFDHNYNFLYRTVDATTKQSIVKPMTVTITSQRELMHLLKSKSNNIQHKKLAIFKDFIQQCTMLNPKHRLTPEKALEHPFLNYQIKLQ